MTPNSATAKDIRTGVSPMQHRHYATIAAIIREMPHDSREFTAQWFANRLHDMNPKFDRARFMRACEA